MKKIWLCAIAALSFELVPCSSEANCCGPSGYGGGGVSSTCEFQSGPCVCECPYTYYKPCYYYTTRCVQEPYPVCRTCCRYVPKQYQVTKCKYVPQYYNETFCKYEPEYYGIQETCYRPRQVCDLQCKYVPVTYVKKTCYSPNQSQPCSPTPSPSYGMCSLNTCSASQGSQGWRPELAAWSYPPPGAGNYPPAAGNYPPGAGNYPPAAGNYPPGRAIGWNGYAAPAGYQAGTWSQAAPVWNGR